MRGPVLAASLAQPCGTVLFVVPPDVLFEARVCPEVEIAAAKEIGAPPNCVPGVAAIVDDRRFASIQEGIDAAAGVVYICPGTYFEGLVVTDRSVALVGQSERASDVILTGTEGPLVTVDHGELWLSHVTLSDGVAVEGGGIHAVSSAVVVQDTVFRGNVARHAGGAIHVRGGDLAVRRSHLVVNEATQHGGGIAVEDGCVDLVSSTLEGNIAGHRGGGIHVAGYAESVALSINQSLVLGNHADRGGGIAVEGIGRSDIDISWSTLQANEATDGAGIATGPGGRTHLDVVGCGLVGNLAEIGGAVSHEAGFHLDQLTIRQSTLASNAARSGAGLFVSGEGDVQVEMEDLSLYGNLGGWGTAASFVGTGRAEVWLVNTNIDHLPASAGLESGTIHHAHGSVWGTNVAFNSSVLSFDLLSACGGRNLGPGVSSTFACEDGVWSRQ